MERYPYLWFIDDVRCFYAGLNEISTPDFSNKEELTRIAVQPSSWRTIEELPGGAELVPARVLTKLPVAIHKASAALRAVSPSSFPLTKDYHLLWPGGRGDPSEKPWSELAAACQQVQVFHFGDQGMNCLPIRPEHIEAEDESYIDRYICAMLSSRSLEEVHINMGVYGLNDGNGSTTCSYYRIGPVLRSTDLSRVRNVDLWYVGLSQVELESLCSSLSPHLEKLALVGMELPDGSWSGTLDLLYDKAGHLHAKGFRALHLGAFTECESGMQREKPSDEIPLLVFDEDSSDEEDFVHPTLKVRAYRYMKGTGEAENALRAARHLGDGAT